MPNYKKTVFACYRGYITQAIIVNLAPLFFVFFREKFGLSFAGIASLTAINFFSQIVVDYFAVALAGKFGYRKCCEAAHFAAVLGLVLLGVLPMVMPPYPGLVIATVLYAVGSGLIEVLISPIVDNVPGEAKAGAMILLHSFYAWGQTAVILLTTLAIRLIGYDYWFVLPWLWALIPLYNAFAFMKVPINEPEQASDAREMKSLFTSGIFYLSILMMIAAGASEQVMAQWASMFAETGLGVSKVVGDLLGPCLFAVFMAIGRTFFGVKGDKLDMRKALFFCACGACACYLLAVFAKLPICGLFGCALTGFMVSPMWPGMLNLASKSLSGSTAMFAFMALAGDVGCTVGPFLTGGVSDLAAASGKAAGFGLTADQFGLKCGILVAIIFPILMIVGTILFKKGKTSSDAE